jgi:hypothetical protein
MKRNILLQPLMATTFLKCWRLIPLYIYRRWALHFVAFVFFLFSYLIWGLWGPRTVGARNPLGPLIGWRLTPPLSSFPRLAHSASGEMSAMRAR